MKSRRRSREEWAHWVERWEASGLPGTKFSRQHRLPMRSLYAWRQRLEAEATAEAETETETETEDAPVERSQQMFTEVRVRGLEPSASRGTIEVVARGGRIIRVTGPVDAAELRAVLEAVEGC